MFFSALQGKEGSVWPVILEKAFAKYTGNYYHLEEDDFTVAPMQMLTGAPGEITKHGNRNVDEIWDMLQTAFKY